MSVSRHEETLGRRRGELRRQARARAAYMERPDVRALLARAQGALGDGWLVSAQGRSIEAVEIWVEPRSPEDRPEAAAARLAEAFGARVTRSRHYQGLAGEVLVWEPSDYYGPAMLVVWEVLP